MKPCIPVFLSLLFAWGCTKYQGEYSINCSFPADFSGFKILVITNYEGDVIGSFDILPGMTSVNEQISFEDGKAPDYYHLHMIDRRDCFPNITSHWAVPNGASVFLGPTEQPINPNRFIFAQINGIESFDSLQWVDRFMLPFSNYQADEKRVNLFLSLASGQGALFRLKANGESEFRHYYLSDTVRVDSTLSLHWQDFKPENPARSIELPGDGLAGILDVFAVSPDFQHHVQIHHQAAFFNTPDPFPAAFSHPAGWPEPSTYVIRTEQTNAAFEKVFQPGEPLKFEPSDLSIGNINTSDEKVSVDWTGDADLLCISGVKTLNSTSPFCSLVWNIYGAPESLRDIEIPNLNKYLPLGVRQNGIFDTGTVTAFQFDKLDYPQVREGFPFKSVEPFAVARSGFKSVWKFYF